MATSSDILKLWFWPWEAARAATRMMETAAATHAVLGVRLPMMSEALINPLGADHREMALMVTEKVGAFSRSQRTLAAAAQAVQRANGANASALGHLAGGGLLGPAEWMAMVERNVSLAVTLMTLPMRAMAPVHRGVTANARRLRKV